MREWVFIVSSCVASFYVLNFFLKNSFYIYRASFAKFNSLSCNRRIRSKILSRKIRKVVCCKCTFYICKNLALAKKWLDPGMLKKVHICDKDFKVCVKKDKYFYLNRLPFFFKKKKLSRKFYLNILTLKIFPRFSAERARVLICQVLKFPL